MKIEFKTNKKSEFNNLLWEIREHKNVISFGLITILPPEEIIDDYEKERSEEGLLKIKRFFNENYDEIKYKQTQIEIESKWNQINNDFFQALKKTLNIKIEKKYTAEITFFGPGGSYWMPDKIILRAITPADLNESVNNLAHEIVHLIVEKKIVKKYNLNHEEKECLVNYIFRAPILRKLLPDYRIPFRHKALPKKIEGKIKLNFDF